MKHGGFCPNHGEGTVEVEISKEDKQKFVDFFLPLYKIVFYLLEKEEELSKEVNRKTQQIL